MNLKSRVAVKATDFILTPYGLQLMRQILDTDDPEVRRYFAGVIGANVSTIVFDEVTGEAAG